MHQYTVISFLQSDTVIALQNADSESSKKLQVMIMQAFPLHGSNSE